MAPLNKSQRSKENQSIRTKSRHKEMSCKISPTATEPKVWQQTTMVDSTKMFVAQTFGQGHANNLLRILHCSLNNILNIVINIFKRDICELRIHFQITKTNFPQTTIQHFSCKQFNIFHAKNSVNNLKQKRTVSFGNKMREKKIEIWIPCYLHCVFICLVTTVKPEKKTPCSCQFPTLLPLSALCFAEMILLLFLSTHFSSKCWCFETEA